MKEQFIPPGTSGNPTRRGVQRIGFIFTEPGEDGGIVRDICECDPLPKNFSMISRFIKMWEKCNVEVYVTAADGSYSERHDLVQSVPEGCRLPRLCVVKDGKSQDLEKWFIEKCRELYPNEVSA